jgi:hypothetical protein
MFKHSLLVRTVARPTFPVLFGSLGIGIRYLLKGDLDATEHGEDMLGEALIMGDNGRRPCELGRLSGELDLVVGPTVLVGGLVGGVSGTRASGEENRVGDIQSVGVLATNADELELLAGVEDELLDNWDEEVDLDEGGV